MPGIEACPAHLHGYWPSDMISNGAYHNGHDIYGFFIRDLYNSGLKFLSPTHINARNGVSDCWDPHCKPELGPMLCSVVFISAIFE